MTKIIAVVLFLLGIGLAGTYAYFNPDKIQQLLPFLKSSQQIDGYAGWKIFRSQNVGIEIKYPPDFEAQEIPADIAKDTLNISLNDRHTAIEISKIGSPIPQVPLSSGEKYITPLEVTICNQPVTLTRQEEIIDQRRYVLLTANLSCKIAGSPNYLYMQAFYEDGGKYTPAELEQIIKLVVESIKPL